MKPKKRQADADAQGGDKPAKLNRTESDFSATSFSNESQTKEGQKPWNFKVST